MAARRDLSWLPPAVYLGGVMPGALLVVRALRDQLGPNPISETLDGTGELAVKLLLLSLACTPARILFGVTWPLRVRKALGLLAFGYGMLHLSIYLFVDQRGSGTNIVEDVVKRPFIAIGMATLALLVPLAATSTKKMRARLGAARWQRLHKLVYVAAALAIVHYTMKQKESVALPLEHGAALALLFGVRIGKWAVDKKRAARASKSREASRRAPIQKSTIAG
jgi:sulfoxide reductase heme-binding subunit YedZ